jgi:hypothetical protein
LPNSRSPAAPADMLFVTFYWSFPSPVRRLTADGSWAGC